MVRRVCALALWGGVLSAIVGAGGPALAEERPQGPEVTVYNGDLGLVKAWRELDLRTGVQDVTIDDIPALIDATTVRLRSLLPDAELRLVEQNFRYDLADRETLLRRYLGAGITLERTSRVGRTVARDDVTLLASRGGMVVDRDGTIVLDPPGTARLGSLPEGVRVKPTLAWTLESTKAGRVPCEISYLTGGLTWRADYFAVLGADESHIDLDGTVTVTNTSGASYRDALLKVVAGDVARVREAPRVQRGWGGGQSEAEDTGGFSEESLFEYHLYALGRPTTLADRETKQIALLSARGVPVRKRYVFRTVEGAMLSESMGSSGWGLGGGLGGLWARRGASLPVAVQAVLRNSSTSNLGMPLPRGVVRVAKADADGSLQFVGGDRIDRTARDEEVALTVGHAFDLVGDCTMLERAGLAPGCGSFRLTLRNHKDTDVEIAAIHRVSGDWRLTKTTHPYVQKDSRTIDFTVQVPAHGTSVVRFTIVGS